MAYEFKKISEVEVMTEVLSDVTVLGVSGGQVVQMPSSGLGGSHESRILFKVSCDGMCQEGPTFEEFVEMINNPEKLVGVYALWDRHGYFEEAPYGLALYSLGDWDFYDSYGAPVTKLDDCYYIEISFCAPRGYYRDIYLTPNGYALTLPGGE